MGRDLREYRRQLDRRLLIGFTLLLFLVGDGLILLIYGTSAALSGLVCLGAGALCLGLLWGVLGLLDRLSRGSGDR